MPKYINFPGIHHHVWRRGRARCKLSDRGTKKGTASAALSKTEFPALQTTVGLALAVARFLSCNFVDSDRKNTTASPTEDSRLPHSL